ncbi:MAG: hypothetical protein HQ567_08170 [Candidatus Nealsonbacteria bacterium]|nr:hypothetical protein [Candidatus Nealsonbacteria bacterium]
MRSESLFLFDDLHRADWTTAARTFGNDHATLIGILTQWWIRLSPSTHTVIEAGPTNGYREKGKRGQCDALFCSSDSPVGVLEVEGSRPIETALKIGYFFDGVYPEIQTLTFGILLVYSYTPTGRGEHRIFPAAITERIAETVCQVSRRHPEKEIVLLGLDKTYERRRDGIRSRNEYYMGVPSLIQGQLWRNGIVECKHTLYTRSTT